MTMNPLDLQNAVEAGLRAWEPLQSEFPKGTVRLYDVPPANAPTPYLCIGEDDVRPMQADGVSLAITDVKVHVWSLTDPPGFKEAKAIAALALAALISLADFADQSVRSAQLVDIRPLIDIGDGRTAHVVVVVRITTETLKSNP